ncbi:ammonium transporter [Marinobacterium lutimaris]|uniref:Ammonium transporter, Amt family n=1 Tax=Marinobacterium lutimaris TaxID=568106 RepID=A0A1H5V4W3_9GAMM|nr:ammonium transporter [Marinobacterium lutimaris]SEF82253.1 ammonium transporter, Amt family [Marinobacterium lutimaris]
MSNQEAFNALWLLLSAVLVLVMQAGFLCLESGLTRSKNAINVALKNAFDLLVTTALFWLVGFSLMFSTWNGILPDIHLIAANFPQLSFWDACFFLFQLTFCATAATIVSGAIAERARFVTYVLITALIAVLIYPLFGHLAWGGALRGPAGWLAEQGFVDFAGSTVVHSLGGWVALAALIVVGPRKGRFVNGRVVSIPGSNLPFAMLGMMCFIIGWIGFNGGSTLEFSSAIPGIIANTLIAATFGGITGMLLGYWQTSNQTPQLTMNGTLAGLVAITAGCHAVTTLEAALIGITGALCMRGMERLLERLKLDDAISATPVHLAAGIWGTLAVGLLGDPERLGTGLDWSGQVLVQIEGILICGAWAFPTSLIFLLLLRKISPLRVSDDAETEGLNSSEHGASTELSDLLGAMNEQERTGDMERRMPVEPFTEVGQIAAKYNQVMAKLNRMSSRTRLILRDMQDGVITFSEQGIITSANPGAANIFGRQHTQLAGQQISKLLHKDCLKLYPTTPLEKLLPLIASSQNEGPHELIGRNAKGEPITIEVTTSASPTGEGVQYSAIVRDIGERKRMEERLHRHSQLAQVTLEAITEAVITCDARMKTVYLNPVARSLTGCHIDEVFNEPIDFVVRLQNMEGDNISIAALCRDSTPAGEYRQLSLIGANGHRARVQLNCAPLHDKDGQSVGWVIAMQDITQNSELQQRLTFQAVHDALTGLINRREFERRLEQLIISARTDYGEHLICYLDLDQFKLVNDTCGHRAGDALLRQLSQELKPLLRQNDTFARLGGDEFGILLADCPVERGLEIAEQLRRTVKDFRFPWEGQVFSVGVSIGLVPFGPDCASLDELLSLADAACYAAKDTGRNRVHLYEADDNELTRRQGQMQWASHIQQAIDCDDFRLYYQTIEALDPEPGAVPHIEIFIRMLDAEGNLIPPGAFVPAAERYDLMPQVDQWVVRNTLAWLGDHLHAGNSQIQCAINLSGASIGSAECLQTIKQHISKHEIPPHLLCFEITETAAMSDPEAARAFIEELRNLGCHFALDDFGSGLSSFGYLKRLPVDYLKIDGIFVRDMSNNEIDQAMIASINNIAHIMELKTVAEFVEDEATLGLLREIGVDFVQGYLLSKPAPLEQLGRVRVMPR